MLKNQTILIAGAGGLLGAKLAAASLAAGADVLAVDRDALSMKNALEKSGVDPTTPGLRMSQLDLTCEQAMKDFFHALNGVDGAVNCTYPRSASYGRHFFDVTLDSFNENISQHLGTSFFFAQQCAVYFRRTQTPFSLVNIASVYGVIAPRFGVYDNTSMTMPVEYAAIKAAIVHLTRYVAAYIKDSRFRVNTVSPGGIMDNQPSDFLNAYRKETHGKGMLVADDVVGTILFLLSTHSQFVTGQNIIIDDGFTL